MYKIFHKSEKIVNMSRYFIRTETQIGADFAVRSGNGDESTNDIRPALSEESPPRLPRARKEVLTDSQGTEKWHRLLEKELGNIS